MKQKKQQGFTIVELVIVIAVIAILAAVLIPTFSNVVSKANESAALQTARNTLSNTITMSNAGALPDGTVISVYRGGDIYDFLYKGGELTLSDTDGVIDTVKSPAQIVLAKNYTSHTDVIEAILNSFSAKNITVSTSSVSYQIGDITVT